MENLRCIYGNIYLVELQIDYCLALETHQIPLAASTAGAHQAERNRSWRALRRLEETSREKLSIKM